MIDKSKIKLKIKQKKINEIKIHTDFIRLDAFLKYCNIAQTGGHAKIIVTEGEIKIDGEVCTQRGKKLRVGDEIEFNKEIYRIV